MVKKTMAPAVVYLTAPVLVVGVLKIEVAPIISHDVSCVLQDPTGNYSMFHLSNCNTSYRSLYPAMFRRSERKDSSRCYYGLW